jgi:hypothetical protein
MIINESIKKTQHNLAKLQAVAAIFPNASIGSTGLFSDAQVNKNYTNFKFESYYNSLYVLPYYEVPYTFDGIEYTINVYSRPRRNRLAKSNIIFNKNGVLTREREISFCKFSVNLKNNNFKLDLLESCKLEVMKFIRSYPNAKIDMKHLDPRLQKLLILL